MTKEKIRANLKMLDENLSNFNDYSLQFIDLKETRKQISAWRWYVSHSYFEPKKRKPKQPASNPPMSWLHSQLQGMTTPLSKDIGLCIQPKIQSSIMTEGAARRIKDRLNMLYHHVTTEDAKKDQELQHKFNILDPAQRKKDAEYEKQRRHKKEAEARKKTPAQVEKTTQTYLKKKDLQRADEHKKREQAQKTAKKKGQGIRKRMEREMKQRRADDGL